MPARESNNDDDSVGASGDESPEVPDWYQTGTRYARWALIGITVFAVLMILVLSVIIDPAQPPG